MRVVGIVGLALAGCSGEATTTTTGTTDPPGACGAVSSMDVHVVGTVEDDDHLPAAGVEIVLVERNWSPGTVHGTATSDADGAFALDGTDLPVVEDCWGTAVSYWLEGTLGEAWGEKPMNPLLMDAWVDGTFQVDLGAFPLNVHRP
ncbi:MAG: carboxypeptidase-like regulatory domain-containing protein [Myxococcota bacterium]